MKTKSVTSLVNRLRRYNAAYARLQTKRQRTPHSLSKPFPDETHAKLQEEANKLCGEIMHTERCIINALLREGVK